MISENKLLRTRLLTKYKTLIISFIVLHAVCSIQFTCLVCNSVDPCAVILFYRFLFKCFSANFSIVYSLCLV